LIAVNPNAPSGEKSATYTVSQPGHLISIDEQPKHDWVHRARIVFFPTANPVQTSIVFKDTPASGLRITSAQNGTIKVTWKEW